MCIRDRKNGIHIVDLHKTAVKLDEACNALEKITSAGKKVLFVATKKQAKEVVAKHASELNMPYITERWPGGMLTNFVTIRKAVKKMNHIDKMKKDGTFETLSKKERLQVAVSYTHLDVYKRQRLSLIIFTILSSKYGDPFLFSVFVSAVFSVFLQETADSKIIAVITVNEI